uniref:CCHC-type domain-containing protein n=1 Tax=Trichuris muris TaxID=70415 RepID=A0A5S6QFZ2_TRIMR
MATSKISVDAEGLRKRRSGLRSRIERLLENVKRFVNEGQAAVAQETLELVDTLLMDYRNVQAEFELCLTDQDLREQGIQACVDVELAVVKAKAVVKATKPKDQTAVAVTPVLSGPNLPEWQLPKFSVIQTLKERFGREEIIVEGHVLALLQMSRADPDQAGIRRLYYNLNRHLRALSSMGKGITNGLTVDDIFLASFKRLLPCASRKRWEQRTRTCADEKANTSMFLSFLHEEMDVQEAAAEAQTATTKQFKGHSWSVKSGASKKGERNASAAALHATVESRRRACRYCKKDHDLLECSRFLNSSPKERWKTVNGHGACYCCLKIGHLARDCKRRSMCKEAACDKFHHELLHIPPKAVTALSPTRPSQSTNDLHEAVVQVGFSSMRSKERVFLQTAQGILKGGDDGRSTVMVLFDVGSQRSFIRKDIAESLRLEGHNERVIISTLGAQLSKTGRHKCVTFKLCSKSGGKETVVSALCIDRICSALESNPPLEADWTHLHGVTLGDSFPRGPATVDVLIGADYYHDFLRPGELRGQVGQPIAVPSTLGWIVCGKSQGNTRVGEIHGMHATIEEPLNEQLRMFWEIESLGVQRNGACENIEGDAREPQCAVTFDGQRYSVSLPWRTEEITLPNNYHVALQRLKQTEERLSRDASLKSAYCAEMDRYIKNGWVEKAVQMGLNGRTW